MNIKTELLKEHITSYINSRIEDFEINADKITDSTAITILGEIQNVLKNDKYNDFDAVEEIVCILQAHGLNCGSRHDF